MVLSEEVILTCFFKEANPWNMGGRVPKIGEHRSPKVHAKESDMVDKKKEGQYVWDVERKRENGENKFRAVGRCNII